MGRKTKATMMLLAVLALPVLGSCASMTEAVLPNLPEMSLETPERPETVDEVTEEAYAELSLYADKLEIVISGWETFYDGMMDIFGSQEETSD